MIIALTLAAVVAYAHPEALVETDWLASHLSDPSIRIVDMRFRGYEDGHVPGAVLLANDAIRNPSNPPTFLPSQSEFEALMTSLGIGNRTRVVAYDDRGGIYAARLWWILNYYRHSNVALLNGGWIKWSREGRAASRETVTPASTTFQAKANPSWLATAQDVVAAINRSGVKIVDARTRAEIEGRELRGIKRGGFIPSSVPVYWEDSFDPDTKAFKPAADLEKLYRDKGIEPSNEVIAYCQVGMRAAHDMFVLHLLGYTKLRNYYGSWEEWGNRDDLPIATVTTP